MTDKLIHSFCVLGEYLEGFVKRCRENPETLTNADDLMLFTAILNARQHNPWFTVENTLFALHSISGELHEEAFTNWLSGYHINIGAGFIPKRVGVIMAGNIPLVGFYDFLYVLFSGHKLVARQSGDDRFLLPAIAKILLKEMPELETRIEFTEGRLTDLDAIIATGSNNSYRYFDYYFGKIPGILRKNRNSIAVLTRADFEQAKDFTQNAPVFKHLADDLFLYFGLGCRNVSKILIPRGEDIRELFPHLVKYQDIIHHNKYRNNYDYYKSIYLINSADFLDTGFTLFLMEKDIISSPVSVVLYDYYSSIEEVNQMIHARQNEIQCVVSSSDLIYGRVEPGKSQFPALRDYADGCDVMQILLGLT